MQVVGAAAMEAAGGARSGHAQERAVRRLPRDAAGRPGALRPRPVRRLPRHRRRRGRTRRPRRTRRCGWRSTTGAGPACRSSSAPASACRSRRPSCGSCSSGRRGSASHAALAPPRAGPARRQARPLDRRAAAARGAARRADVEPEQINLDMEFGDGGRRRARALRGAAARRDAGRQHALQAPGRRRGGVAGDAAAGRRAAAGPPLREGLVGAGRGRPAARRPRPLARALGGVDEPLRRDRHRQRRRRRHARPPPRPVGQARPAARARRLARRASRRTGRRTTCSSTTATCRRTPGTTSDGKPFQPQVHYFVGGATKLYGAALYRLRAEDFGELRHHDGISPAWPIAYDELEPYYTLAEQLYEVHGARGEDPTEPPASAPYPFPAVSHEPRIQQLSDDLAAAGLHPFHAPCGVRLHEDDMPHSHCVRCATCDGFPCLVHAKSDAEVLGVRPALEHANVTLLTNAEAVRLETNADGTRGHRRRRRARRRARDLHRRPRRRLLRRGEQRAAAARVRERGAPGRARQRLRPGRAQLHVPQQPGRARALEGAEPDGLPEDARAQRLLLRVARLRLPARQHPDGRQVVGGDVPRREAAADPARAASARSSDVARHAVDFWLSTEDLPRPDNRVTLRDDGGDPAQLHADQRGARSSGCCTSSSRCSGSSACTTTT